MQERQNLCFQYSEKIKMTLPHHILWQAHKAKQWLLLQSYGDQHQSFAADLAKIQGDWKKRINQIMRVIKKITAN